MSLQVILTVNLILALVQTFYLGMQWERFRQSQQKKEGVHDA